MKRICLIITFCFVGIVGVNAQCTVPSGFVCITQSAADNIAHDLDELKASRVALTKYAQQALLTDAERNAAQTLVKALNDAMDVRGRIIADQTQMIALQKQVIETYSQLVGKLTEQLNKPKSAWQKLVATLEKITILLAGVAIAGL